MLLAVLDVGPAELPDLVVHVHGQADLPPPIGDGPGDGLPDPPRGIRGELEPPAPVEQLDGPHQADVAFLDQVQEGQALALVLPGDRHDQAEVGPDEPLPGLPALADALLGLADGGLGSEPAPGQLGLGLLPVLDGHGQLDLLLFGEEGLPSGRLQVETDVIRFSERPRGLGLARGLGLGVCHGHRQA